ncbi:MAG: hypothetical protein D6734_12935 [Candidatus Schekmanbacteria bacterium]|nr:MAG: hypothetical protein D6734_12935 [Candidatus Schekmanbacteria bacterium]
MSDIFPSKKYMMRRYEIKKEYFIYFFYFLRILNIVVRGFKLSFKVMQNSYENSVFHRRKKTSTPH